MTKVSKEIGRRGYLIGIMITFGLSGFLSGCSVQGDSEPLVTLSPESAVVTLGTTKQFALATGGTAATWSVNNVAGGDSSVGTIGSDGLYTAPPLSAIDTTEVPPENVTIKGTDASGSSGSAIAFLTTFKANKRLTQYTTGAFIRADTYSAGQKGIAVYKDGSGITNVYAVWSDDSEGVSRIWFARSSDGGATFDAPIAVDEGTSPEQISPAITVDGSGNVYVVWEDYRDLGDAKIFMKKYDAAGFGIRKMVNSDIGGIVDYDTTPSIAVNTLGDIYVVWEHRDDSTDERPDIYFAKSTNQGVTFSQSAIDTEGRRPSIAVDVSGVAYTVWEGLTGFPDIAATHVMMSKIESSGPEIPQQVDSLSAPYNARYPAVAVGPGGKVYVVWERAVIAEMGFTGEIISTYYMDIATVNAATLAVLDTTLTFPDDPNEGFFGGRAYPSIAVDSTDLTNTKL
ncbi:MAG: exo-alpha-sialidase [Nitrospirae bacterium]|nr:exo-alpha-sialidase [Nitrospirota bacterium]